MSKLEELKELLIKATHLFDECVAEFTTDFSKTDQIRKESILLDDIQNRSWYLTRWGDRFSDWQNVIAEKVGDLEEIKHAMHEQMNDIEKGGKQ